MRIQNVIWIQLAWELNHIYDEYIHNYDNEFDWRRTDLM